MEKAYDFSEIEYYKAEQQTIIAIVSGKKVSLNPNHDSKKTCNKKELP